MAPVVPFLAAFLACTGDESPPGNGGADGTGCTDITFTPSSEIGTVGTVSWSTDGAGTSWVEFGDTSDYGVSTPVLSDLTTSHQVVLAGLPSAEISHFRGASEVDGAVVYTGDCTVEPAPAPGALPGMDLETAYAGAPRPGFVVTGGFGAQHTWIFAVDNQGRYVWWKLLEDEQQTTGARVSLDGTGVLYPSYSEDHSIDESYIHYLSWDQTVSEDIRTPNGHHDFAELPDGTFAYPAVDIRDVDSASTGETMSVVGDSIVELDPATGETREVWNAWDWLDPGDPALLDDTGFYPQGVDWAHFNTVDYIADRDAYLFTSYTLSIIFLVDRQTGENIWWLGEGAGDFTLTDGAWFHSQHSPEFTDGGLVLFDNTNERVESRLLELSLDESAMTAAVDWTYTEPTGLWVLLLGDVHRFDDGQTLSTWGTGGYIAEIAPDGSTSFRVQAEAGNVLGFFDHADTMGGVAP
jgi:hypothetical protein